MAGYTFVLAEKPQAAQKIAQALAEQRPTIKRLQGLSYFDVEWHGQRLVIAPAVGHLYGVAQEKRSSAWPVFEITWKPIYEVDRTKTKLRSWLSALESLGRDASNFISATDYDVEGSLIAYCILKFAVNAELSRARRVKFSTLSRQELQEAFTHPQPTLDFGLIEAGRTRHELDWLFGINTSRALMSALRQTGLFEKLSAGRVQSPTLYELVKREASVRSFVPTPYFVIEASAEIDGGVIPVFYEKKKIPTLREASRVVEDCNGKFGVITEIVVSERRVPPPVPFNLSLLQRESYRLFRFTPSRTLRVAENLYLQALISYPRTDSQKLPPNIGYHSILEGLAKASSYAPLVAALRQESRTLRPVQGSRDDPAHPAIYPTGNLPASGLSNDELRVFDLIVKRFLAAFSMPYLKQLARLVIESGVHRFFGYGSRLLQEGWLKYYQPYAAVEEVALPPVVKGQDVFFKSVRYLEKFTQPPPRYNSSSLLRFMEEQNIGTKATRAETIETLHRRGYVNGEPMGVTDIGWATVEALRRNFRDLLSVELTRHFEELLREIESGSRTREDTVGEAVQFLRGVYSKFAETSAQTAQELASAIRETRRNSRTLGECPVCHKGELRILVSSRSGKRFVGCSQYFEGGCKYTAPLPQRGPLEPLQKACQTCGYPMVRARSYRGRPWNLCINTECPSKAGWKKSGVPSLQKTS